jgi:hypothetical protein
VSLDGSSVTRWQYFIYFICLNVRNILSYRKSNDIDISEQLEITSGLKKKVVDFPDSLTLFFAISTRAIHKVIIFRDSSDNVV